MIDNSKGGRASPQSLQRYIRPAYVVPVLIVLALIVLYFISGSDPAVKTFTYHHLTMDTLVEIRFQCSSVRAAEQIRDDVFEEMERLEKLFSRSLEESEVNAVNREAGIRPVPVSPEVYHVISEALYFAELSGGAFDPTVAPLTDLWGFLGQAYRVPAAAEIETALGLVDYRLVEIDPEQQTVFLPLRGMALELGGIAKGYIVDRAMALLREAGVRNAFVNAGGDIGLIGVRPDGEPWRIGVDHPRRANEILAVIPMSDLAVVTSGDYVRTFEEGGITYHHILDPASGWPARDLALVTVTAEKAIEADALSTAVFVLGPQRGLELIEKRPGVEGILVTPQLDLFLSGGLEDLVELVP